MSSPAPDTRRPVTVVVTCAASVVIPGILTCMRDSPLFRYRIVAVDAQPDGVGRTFADAYHQVVFGDREDEYVPLMREICAREQADVLLPISDEENLTLSKHRAAFAQAGTRVLCNEYEPTRTAVYKDQALRKLESGGIAVPLWRAPTSVEEFDAALDALGFPAQDVVFKPIKGRGSRGFRIIRERFDEFDQILQKQELYIDVHRLRRLLEARETFPAILLMEYLPGTSMSIDILASHGKAQVVIPHERLAYRWGFLDRALLVQHPAAREMVADIVALFGFDNLVNVELNYNAAGEPRLVEISPRATASLAQNRLCGVNILDLAVAAAIGHEVAIPTHFRDTIYTQYWSEIAEHPGGVSPC